MQAKKKNEEFSCVLPHYKTFLSSWKTKVEDGDVPNNKTKTDHWYRVDQIGFETKSDCSTGQ